MYTPAASYSEDHQFLCNYMCRQLTGSILEVQIGCIHIIQWIVNFGH